MMAQVLYPTTFSSVTQPGQQGRLAAQARDPGRNKKGCERGCPHPPGTTKGGLGWASAPWPGAQERQGKGPRYQPFPHSLPHSFQQPFFDHLLLGAEDSQPKDTASGRSSSGEDSKINKHLSPAIHVWVQRPSSGSHAPSELASPDTRFTLALCLDQDLVKDRDGEGDLTHPVNPETNTAPRKRYINVHKRMKE